MKVVQLIDAVGRVEDRDLGLRLHGRSREQRHGVVRSSWRKPRTEALDRSDFDERHDRTGRTVEVTRSAIREVVDGRAANVTIEDRLRDAWARYWTERGWVRAAFAAVATTFGLTVAFLSAALGHCSSFGGSCPGPPQPWWQDDVFGGVLVGVTLATFAIVVALRPGRRGVLLAVGTAVAVGLPVAIIVRGLAHNGL